MMMRLMTDAVMLAIVDACERKKPAAARCSGMAMTIRYIITATMHINTTQIYYTHEHTRIL